MLVLVLKTYNGQFLKLFLFPQLSSVTQFLLYFGTHLVSTWVHNSAPPTRLHGVVLNI
jgi:hypothetical protein